jgi:hypothetical protein
MPTPGSKGLDPSLAALFAKDGAAKADIPEGEKLTTARELAKELYMVDSSIAQLEQELEEAKKVRTELVQRKMPTYFDSIGIDRLGIPGSEMDVVVENYYHANIPKDREEEAFNWLEENEHGDLIKTHLSMQFGRGELEVAKKVTEQLAAMFRAEGVEPRGTEIKMGVQWNTLTAFVREQTEMGNALPLELLGATVGRIMKIKKRKK